MEACLLVASVLVGLLGMYRGCSPPEGIYVPPTLDEKLMNSDVVLHGVALSVEPETRFAGDDVYTVTFEVHCIYKGGPIGEVIQIEEAGSVPGHCFTKDLEVGQSYLVYLDDRNGAFVQGYPADPGSGEYLEEIVALCDATIRYPTGSTENNRKGQCPPPPHDHNDCQPNSVTEPPRPESDSAVVPGSPANPDDTPVIAPSREDNGSNSSAALTWHLVTLLLVLSIFLL